MISYQPNITSQFYWNIYYFKNNNIVCLLDFKRVAEEKECIGTEIYAGYLKTLQLCRNACKGEASMFVYARTGTSKCNDQGCRCFCETASEDGKCTMKDNSNYNLYAYTVKEGEIIITKTFFRYLINIRCTIPSILTARRGGGGHLGFEIHVMCGP